MRRLEPILMPLSEACDEGFAKTRRLVLFK